MENQEDEIILSTTQTQTHQEKVGRLELKPKPTTYPYPQLEGRLTPLASSKQSYKLPETSYKIHFKFSQIYNLITELLPIYTLDPKMLTLFCTGSGSQVYGNSSEIHISSVALKKTNNPA